MRSPTALVYTHATFREVSEQFLELRRVELRESTILRFYTPVFNSFLSVLPNKPLASYSPLDIQIYIKEKLRGGVSGTSINIALRGLRAFGNWCALIEILPERNAFSRAKQLRVEDKPVRWLTQEEFLAILKAESSDTLRAIYQLAGFTGIRLSALLNLKWTDVDRKGKCITFNSSTSKNKKTQTLPLSNKAVKVFNQLPNQQHDKKFIYVFQKRSACLPIPLSSSYVSHRFLKCATDLKLEGVHFHCLRKTFGSWLIQNGANICAVSQLLTHSSVTTTQRAYVGVSLSALRTQVNKFPA